MCDPTDDLDPEEQAYLRSLRKHGQVIDADSEDAPLPPGVTHVLVRSRPGEKPRLVEKRKSAF
jgi:hypothetical protein